MPWTATGAREADAATKGRAASTLGLAAAVAPGVEVPAREWSSSAPAAGRNEPHESSPLSGLKERKFERRREFQKLVG